MSVIHRRGHKILLPRTGDHFWDLLREAFDDHDNRAAWRRLAIFALADSLGWPLDRIAATFGSSPRHIARCLKQTKRDLRTRLKANAPMTKPE